MKTSPTRFWAKVTVEPSADDRMWVINLDGRPLKLPQGTRLAIASKELATAVAEEWAVLPPGARYSASLFPLTQLMASQIEHVAPQRADIISRLVDYGMTDALCYRPPGVLGVTMEGLMTPPLRHFAERYGVMPAVTQGVMPLEHAPDLKAVFCSVLATLGDAYLTCVSVCAQATGSLILALGLTEGWVTMEQACTILEAEERHHMAKWGEDPVVLEAVEQKKKDVADAMRFLRLFGKETALCS